MRCALSDLYSFELFEHQEVLTKNVGKENMSKRRRASSLSFVDSDEDKPIEVLVTTYHCLFLMIMKCTSQPKFSE